MIARMPLVFAAFVAVSTQLSLADQQMETLVPDAQDGIEIDLDADELDWTACRVTKECTIEFDRLSNQNEFPFLFYGKIVNREHPKWRRYKKALRQYRDVRDCLVKEERRKAKPNLLLFDWENIRLSRPAEVCLFHIASSLGNTDRVIQWMNYHDFFVTGPARLFGETTHVDFR